MDGLRTVRIAFANGNAGRIHMLIGGLNRAAERDLLRFRMVMEDSQANRLGNFPDRERVGGKHRMREAEHFLFAFKKRGAARAVKFLDLLVLRRERQGDEKT